MFLFSICGTIISVSLAGWIRSRLADFESGGRPDKPPGG